MMRKTAILALVGSAAAFAPAAVPALRSTNAASCMQMNAEGVSRRDFAGLAGAAIIAAPALANADVEYANVPFLGGSDQVDVNNANIRVYTRFPGMYPAIAGIIVKNGPYKSTEDIIAKIGDKLTPEMKAIYSKYEKNLVALKPAPEYQEDIWNNGLYR
jgi:photosystem II PsbU protein